MGCFDVTCRLTNTAISSGEDCILVILENDSNENFYDLNQSVYKQSERESQELEKYEIELIEKNSDFSIGWFLPINGVYVGKYNDYGSLEDDSILPDNFEEKYRMEHTLFFHQWAVEFILEDKMENLMKNKIEFVSKLFIKINFFRKSLLDLSLSGQQHKDIKEMQNMIDMNERINSYLKEKIEEYKNKGWAG